MFTATVNFTSTGRPASPAASYVKRVEQTSRIGAAMESVLVATDELRRRLEERGDDAEAIMLPLEEGLDAAWEAIG